MRDSINLNSVIKPRILLRSLDANGKEISRQVARNTLTYAAADVFMNALLKSGPSQITHLYARFGVNASLDAWLSPVSNDLKTVTRTEFLSAGAGDTARGGLWVPVLSAPAQDTTNQNLYTGNSATFYFRIPYNLAVAQTQPVGNFRAEGNSTTDSYVYALGLAVAYSIGDRSQDVIISVLQAIGNDLAHPTAGDFTKFSVPPGGQMAVDYTIPFSVAVTQ